MRKGWDSTKARSIGFGRYAWRRDRDDPPDILSAPGIEQLLNQITKLCVLREIYEGSFEDCRLIYGRVPSPRKMETRVQVLKQLWKRRRLGGFVLNRSQPPENRRGG
jgi:hypothetical protein